MKDQSKTKQALIQELVSLRQRVAELKQSESERNRLEEASQLERDRLMSIMNSIPDGVYIVDQQCNIQYINPVIEKEFGAVKGRKCYTYFHDLIEVCPWCKNAEVFAGKSVRWEWYSFKNDRHYDLIDLPFKNPDGSIAKFEIFHDITDRKRAEEKIHASLREKDILLAEIHHRVKNNLQVISSLLDIQARASGNPEVTEMCHESQRRILSMAMVHEKLYASQNFTKIDMVGYIETLSQELFQAHKVNPWKIEMIVKTDDVYMDINKGIPCGLILNELISNALKHAFPGDREGKLETIIRVMENTEIEIVVCDNGVGLPDYVDIDEPRTVGLYLVNGLVKNQLDGRMEVRRANGTEFRITFPL